PIPNRTVKRLCADDSAATSVKVGHRQAFIKKPSVLSYRGFLLCADGLHSPRHTLIFCVLPQAFSKKKPVSFRDWLSCLYPAYLSCFFIWINGPI
ncbi:hypothetical protein, partial [Collimonas sp.]|uniref:hypothetical protein n=1 Tax=Collimonas sp. TaxID=1963772 RepID=UPI002BF579EA